MNLPKQALYALQKLNQNGYLAYCVGGCIRDAIMQKPIHDIDMNTNATQTEICDVFSEYRLIKTGIKHGTVTVVIDGLSIEITTFRQDGNYGDNRHPDKVFFTNDLLQDLKRRDFTINTICYNPSCGYVDKLKGKKDIQNKIIKAVGNPDERFKQDALRILRAIRFSAVLGFEIEPDTKKALFQNKNLLQNISAERIRQELDKIITAENIEKCLLQYYEIIHFFMPEIINTSYNNTENNPQNIFAKKLAIAKNVEKKVDLRLAVLLNNFSNIESQSSADKTKVFKQVSTALKRLKYDNNTQNKVLDIIKNYNLPLPKTEIEIKKVLSKLNAEIFFDVINIKKSQILASNENIENDIKKLEEIRKKATEIILQNQCISIKQLQINGDDLTKLGIPKTKLISNTLNYLLDCVIQKPQLNQKQQLIKLAKKFYALQK